MVLLPVLVGVYVNVPLADPDVSAAKVTVVGEKQDKHDPSEGVMTIELARLPVAATVKLPEATETVPLAGLGAVSVYVVAVVFDTV
jgi:hypothetical protein